MRCFLLLASAVALWAGSPLPPQITFQQGLVNSVRIGSSTAVYGVAASAKSVRRLLLTHARRDAIGRHPKGVALFVPAAERESFTDPRKSWEAFESSRFHDYAQRSTKTPTEPYDIFRAVSDKEEITASEARITVIASPGFTPGAVSYLVEARGKRILCTGDLIYGDGKLLDLYSLQDAIP